MRILHLLPSLGAGGAERLVLDIAARLLPVAEQEIGIIHPRWLYPDFYTPQAQRIGLRITYLDKPVGKWGRLPLLWRYWRLLHRFKPDLIHAVQWDSADLARVVHHFWDQTPVVVGVHDLVLGDTNNVAHERRFHDWAEKTIAVAPITAEVYQQHVPIHTNKLIVIENGVDLTYFAPGDRATARRQVMPDLTDEQIMILLPARFTSFKNHRVLVEAVQQLVATGQWDQRAVVVCAGGITEQEVYEDTLNFIQTHQLANIIHIIPPTDARLLYWACDAALLISKYEAMGLVAIEAAACERLVLVSEAVNRLGVFQPGQTGWVVPTNDMSALAQALAAVIALSREERDQIGRAARAAIPAHLSLDHAAQRYLETFRAATLNFT